MFRYKPPAKIDVINCYDYGQSVDKVEMGNKIRIHKREAALSGLMCPVYVVNV